MSPMKSRYSVILEYLKMIKMLIIMHNYDADYHENYLADNPDDDLCLFVWVGG